MNTALFVDFEDLHRVLGGLAASEPGGGGASRQARDRSLEIIGKVLKRLREDGDAMVLGRSYAAFDAQPGSEVAHDLALLGLEPQYVLFGSEGRGSVDVQLTFDVARVLFRRPDIERIVVVSGSREFLPLAREVLEEGRELTVVSVGRATSGDLRERIGSKRFVDAEELLASSRAEPQRPVREPSTSSPEPEPKPEPRPAGPSEPESKATDSGAVVLGRIPVTWGGGSAPADRRGLLLACVELLLRARQRHGSEEIWLSPFLKGPMSQAFAHIVHPERRALINDLRSEGAIRVEERENLYAQHPYSVIVVVDAHPLVRDALARVAGDA
ncbi:MAG: NYN domain-containing protein [Planctomycetota bacterium]